MKLITKTFILAALTILVFLTSPLLHAKFDINTLKTGGALLTAPAQKDRPTVDQAFIIDAFIKKNQIQILVSALPHTYIYQPSIRFSTDNKNIILGSAKYPAGEMIDDEHYGHTKIFKDNFEILIPYQASNSQAFQLTMDFQGCLKDVLCYPPKQLTFDLNIEAPSTVSDSVVSSTKTSVLLPMPEQPALVPLTKNTKDSENTNTDVSGSGNIDAVQTQNQAVNILKNSEILGVVSGFIIFGLLLSLTPCVLPMLPILSGIIVGHKHNMTKRHAFMLSFVYVLSMALTYMLAGILVASVGVNLISSLQHPVVLVIVCVLFLFLACASFGLFELKVPNFITQKLNKANHSRKGGTYLGVALLGIIAALIISPCATAPLAGALLYISSTGNIWLGGLALFSMGFAMGIPILLFGTSAGHWLPKAGPWMKEINIFFGIVFIGLAIYILSRLLEGPMILILWGLLLIFYAVHLGVLEPATHGWQRIKKGLALVFAIYGGFLLAGAAQNNSDIWHPFGQNQNLAIDSCTGIPNISTGYTRKNNPNELSFTKIKTIPELTKNLLQAKTEQKFTVLTFYADWCVSCRNIEEKVFTDPKIKNILKNFTRLQVDLTKYNSDDKKIMSELTVFNPPTLIFYDQNGREIANSRVTSEINVPNLYQLISNFALTTT